MEISLYLKELFLLFQMLTKCLNLVWLCSDLLATHLSPSLNKREAESLGRQCVAAIKSEKFTFFTGSRARRAFCILISARASPRELLPQWIDRGIISKSLRAIHRRCEAHRGAIKARYTGRALSLTRTHRTHAHLITDAALMRHYRRGSIVCLASFDCFNSAIRLTGPFVTMVYSMITGDMLTFGIIYLVVLFGFCQSFYFLYKGFPGVKSSLYGYYHSTWMALFQITLGDYNVSSAPMNRDKSLLFDLAALDVFVSEHSHTPNLNLANKYS